MCVRVQHTTIGVVASQSLSAANTVADSLISDWFIQHSDEVLNKCAQMCLWYISSSYIMPVSFIIRLVTLQCFQAWIVEQSLYFNKTNNTERTCMFSLCLYRFLPSILEFFPHLEDMHGFKLDMKYCMTENGACCLKYFGQQV